MNPPKNSAFTTVAVNNNAATIDAPVQEESEQGEGIIVVSAPVTAVHDWDEGTITKEPTTTEEGVKTFKCKATLINKVN